MKVIIGNIFESKAETLVNTVNCVGVMGKGIALEFKKKYPDMFKEYVELCRNGTVKPGKPYLYSDLYGTSIINFPTKDHWRSASQLEYIIDGLKWFRENYKELKITSVAFPPLGCGNGGLSWKIVGPLMYSMLSDLPIDIEIYAPYGTGKNEISEEFLSKETLTIDNVLGNRNGPLNKYWLLILYVIQKLNNDIYALRVGRTIFQKVCYVITRAGIQTGFNFVEGYYGPYAKEVNDAVIALSNANLMKERTLGKMIETVVAPEFMLPNGMFTKNEMEKADRAVDLLSRIQSTSQAEMVATVLYSYDKLLLSNRPTGEDVVDYVISWKRHWKNNREAEIMATVLGLSALGWMNPKLSEELLLDDCV